MSSEGDALFEKAAQSVIRSGTPRDGGAAIGVLADWIAEQMSQRSWLAVGDPAASGFVLIVVGREGADDTKFSVTLVDTESESTWGQNVNDFGEKFKKELAADLNSAWHP